MEMRNGSFIENAESWVEMQADSGKYPLRECFLVRQNSKGNGPDFLWLIPEEKLILGVIAVGRGWMNGMHGSLEVAEPGRLEIVKYPSMNEATVPFRVEADSVSFFLKEQWVHWLNIAAGEVDLAVRQFFQKEKVRVLADPASKPGRLKWGGRGAGAEDAKPVDAE